MRAVIQRVKRASVTIEGKIHSEIEDGILLLLGIGKEDAEKDIDWLVRKVVNLRIFPDDDSKMNHSVNDIKGDILVISQFTLFASYKKGNRPSYINAAHPEKAKYLYEMFLQTCKEELVGKLVTGIFAADMKVELLNDGPVTIFMDSKDPE